MTKTLKKDINTKKFLLAISPELYEKLKKMSVKSNRTVQGQVRHILGQMADLWEKKYGNEEPKEEEPPDGGDPFLDYLMSLHEGAIFTVRGHEAV